jgi:amidase
VSDELLTSSATRLAAMIRERRVSCREVAEAHLRRIARVNPLISAVVQCDRDAVIQAAVVADEALARGDGVGPLHGVPFTVKDWIETSDYPCAAGFEERRNFVPKRDATVVARMRAAGAILLGKTNVTEGAPVYERPNNPYDLERTPGGSSSGEGAIIGAGGSPLGLGSDSGGSIRLPAAWCGVAGLKPTNGLVPSTGHFPPITPMHDPRTTIGPLARRVEDLALALRVIAGPDARDAGVAPVSIGDAAAIDVASLRVAWYADMPGATTSPDAAASARTAIDALRAAGASIAEPTPPRLDESMPITIAYWARTSSISLTEWRPYRESTLTADEIERSIFEWERFRGSMLRFMDPYDVIVCPAAPYVAPEHRSLPPEDYVYTLPYSLTGYPVAVVRAGTSAEGLPVGVQVVARPCHDHVAIAAASVIERATGGWEIARLAE